MAYDPNKSFVENLVAKTVVRIAVDSVAPNLGMIGRNAAVAVLERIVITPAARQSSTEETKE